MIQHTIVNMWTLLLLQRSRFLMGPLHIITFQFCIDEFVQNFSSSTFYTSFFHYNFFEFFLPFLIPIFFSSLGSCEFSFWVQQEYDVYLRLRMRYLEWKVGWTVFSLPHLLPSSSLCLSSSPSFSFTGHTLASYKVLRKHCRPTNFEKSWLAHILFQRFLFPCLWAHNKASHVRRGKLGTTYGMHSNSNPLYMILTFGQIWSFTQLSTVW